MPRPQTPIPQLLISLAAVLLTAISSTAQQSPTVHEIPGLPATARIAAASIDPEKECAHVRFLSLDLLEGHVQTKRGAELAAEYIATQFALAGVEAAGDNGTNTEAVPLMARSHHRRADPFLLRPRSRRSNPAHAYGAGILPESNRPAHRRL